MIIHHLSSFSQLRAEKWIMFNTKSSYYLFLETFNDVVNKWATSSSQSSKQQESLSSPSRA